MIQKFIYAIGILLLAIAMFYGAMAFLFATPQVYFSHQAHLRGKLVCTKVVTYEGEKPCSMLKTLVSYQSNWSK
jgi:hypothetical protein